MELQLGSIHWEVVKWCFQLLRWGDRQMELYCFQGRGLSNHWEEHQSQQHWCCQRREHAPIDPLFILEPNLDAVCRTSIQHRHHQQFNILSNFSFRRQLLHSLRQLRMIGLRFQLRLNYLGFIHCSNQLKQLTTECKFQLKQQRQLREVLLLGLSMEWVWVGWVFRVCKMKQWCPVGFNSIFVWFLHSQLVNLRREQRVQL